LISKIERKTIEEDQENVLRGKTNLNNLMGSYLKEKVEKIIKAADPRGHVIIQDWGDRRTPSKWS